MRVHRTKLSRGFVQISNEIARHRRLSLEAVGLLVRLLSLPAEAREATVERITDRVSNGRRSVSRAMNELVSEGYVTRARVQDPETGRWVTLTSVTDTPAAQPPAVGELGSRDVGDYPKEETPQENTPSPDASEQPSGCETDSSEKEGEGEAPQERNHLSAAIASLGRVGSIEPRLRLTLSEVTRLAPKAAVWLSEGVSEALMIKTLTRALPVTVQSAAALISYRLSEHTPEEQAPVIRQEPVQRAACQACESYFPAGVVQDICQPCAEEMARAAAHLSGSDLPDPHESARQAVAAHASNLRDLLRINR